MVDTIKARRAALVKTHAELMEQHAHVSVNLERVRGAIALCDELLAESEAPGAPAPDET